MRTLFWTIFLKNAWVQHRLYRTYGISPWTLKKATNTDTVILWSSKEKIYNALVDMKLIKEEEVSLLELFSAVWEKESVIEKN
jgi:hypothetical protein